MILRQLALVTLLLSATCSYSQTRQQTSNLYTLAKLYGYVRYFHPSDANVMTDWDMFAIYCAEQVDKAANQQELQQTLEKLFRPIAPSLRIYPAGTPSTYKPADIMPGDTAGMKTVTWQHNGYGAGSNNQTYRSIRTNSYIKEPLPRETSPFSTIYRIMPATSLQGRMVRYSAAIRAEDLSSGKGQLWLRVDRSNNKMGFFNNMDDRPFTGIKRDWRRDTIIGKIDADAANITVGCFIIGKGSLLLDDVKLEVQSDSGWQTLPLNGDFETGSEGWTNNADRFMTISTVKQAIQGKQSLLMERGKSGGLTKTTWLFPDNALPAGTVITKNIGSGLAITMPVALWGDGQQTYPLTDTAAIVRMNNMIDSTDDLYVRLADIIITWNVFQHFHPYYKEWIADWDKDLQTALADCYQNKTQDDFYLTLKKMVATMRDGHTGVYSPVRKPVGFLPMVWNWVENKLVVTRVLSGGEALHKGDEITAINGVSAEKYIDSVMKTVCAGTPQALHEAAAREIRMGLKDSSLLLSVEGKKVPVTYSLIPADYYKMVEDTGTGYRKIDADHIYVHLSLMPWKELQKKLPEMAKAKTVIFDLRGYPKDENGSSILAHLIQSPEHSKWMQKQRIILPDHERTAWDSMGWNVSPARPHIGGKVFFLTDDSAISYAESVMGYVKGQHLATIIGEPTAGANGDINYVPLPDGYTFSFTGLKATTHNGAQHFMKGIQPDVIVRKTVKGIREGRDELLEKALELSK